MSTSLEGLVTSSNFKFSATRADKLGATEYTLACVAVDKSGSVAGFATQLETALKSISGACKKSPRADNLMMRVLAFDHQLTEVHGFKLLSTVEDKDYDGVITCCGGTALNEAAVEAVETVATYGKTLVSQDYLVNAIVFIITDGRDESNNSRTSVGDIQKAIKAAQKAECLESLTVVLVGVTNDDANLDAYLKNFKDDAGITQYVSIGTATPGKLAKLASFVSRSISSTSSALGTGGPSQPLTI